MLRKLTKGPKSSTNLSVVAAAALVGGLAGAFVGLMVAPSSGRELRRNIRQKANDTKERVEDATSYHTETWKRQSSDIVRKGKKLADDLQTFIQESLNLKKSYPISVTQAEDTPSGSAYWHSSEAASSLSDETENQNPPSN